MSDHASSLSSFQFAPHFLVSLARAVARGLLCGAISAAHNCIMPRVAGPSKLGWCQPAEPRMWSMIVVIVASVRGAPIKHCVSAEKSIPFKNSSRSRLLKLSMKAFWSSVPDAMYRQSTVVRSAHCRTALPRTHCRRRLRSSSACHQSCSGFRLLCARQSSPV